MWKFDIRPFKHTAVVSAALALSACGGGGGSSGPTLTDPASPSINLSATSTELAVQQPGSYRYPDQTRLFTTEITAVVRDSQGNVIPGGGPVEFSVQGGRTDIGALYQPDFEDKVEITLADGSTQEVPAAFWGLPMDVSGSQARVLFQSHTKTGPATITAVYEAPNGGVASESITIDVTSPTATGFPSTFDVNVNPNPIFITGQDRNDQATVEAYLMDAANQPVNAPSGNNVRAEIMGDDLGGAYLIGSDGQRGQSITTSTTGDSGLARFTVLSGNQSGSLHLKLTADGEDNNVDNGIQQAVVKEDTVSISDGRVASLSFGGPFIDAIINNQASAEIEEGEFIDQGVYSRSVTVVVQDAEGNPIPNETVRFGLIDSPIESGTFPNPGFSPQPSTPTTTSGPRFAIQGTHGNPVEGGSTFTQTDGVNLVAEGVHQLDRLVLWPDEQGTEREMLVSRLVATLPTEQSLTVTRNFPFNEVPGYVDGNNIPWVVGRAQYGNIGATAVTDENGAAQTFVNYPVSRLNQPAIITAEAENGVTTHFGLYYAGVAEGSLTSSVTSIPPNDTTPVTMCATDANRVPRPGIDLSAGLTNGVTVSGSLTTGANGCASFTLNTEGVPAGSESFEIPFSSGAGEDESIEITVEAAASVEAPVISIGGQDTSTVGDFQRTVTVSVLDSNGQPAPGQTVILGTGVPSDADDTDSPAPAIVATSSATETTDSNGVATFTIDYEGQPGDTFEVEATVQGNTTSTPFPY